MNKCVFYTYAYNAEKTIERTIRSVLTQTDPNLVYYIVDNGATDRTGELIRAAAARDDRMIPLRNEKNHVWEPGNQWLDIYMQQEDSDFFCWLDADDEYKPDFFEKMRRFMRIRGLEAAACGYDFVDQKTGRLRGTRAQPRDVILEGRGFSDYFPAYHQFLRTCWGGLYSIAVMKRIDWSKEKLGTITYGGDTLIAMAVFRESRCAGIYHESLHRYMVSPASKSYHFDMERGQACVVLYDTGIRYLQEKCGAVTERNRMYLLAAFTNDIRDVIQGVLNDSVPAEQKWELLLDAFNSEPGQAVLNTPAMPVMPEVEASYQKQRKDVLDYLASCPQPREGAATGTLEERFSHLQAQARAAAE